MQGKNVVAAGLVILATLLGGAGLASAKKPPKPPPPPPNPVDTGVLYFGQGTVYSLLPDGSGLTEVVDGLPGWSPPSHSTHGGERWFLTFGVIAGDQYPDGRLRYEVFAVSESGQRVQVTDAPQVQPRDPTNSVGVDDLEQVYASLCWAVGDTRISYLGREWSGGVVTGGGVYHVDLPTDIAQLQTPVTPVCLPLPTEDHPIYGPQVMMVQGGVAWSPTGDEVAYAVYDDGLFTRVLATGATTQWTSDAHGLTYLRWSPDGTALLFAESGDVVTLALDGSGSAVILSQDRKGTPDQPSYSPSGSHVLFRYRSRNKVQLRTATAGGSNVTTILASGGPYSHWVSE